MCEPLSKMALVFSDPRSGPRVERAATRQAIRNDVVALTESLTWDVFLSFIKDNTYTEKSLQGWYPMLYRALISHYIKVGNLVIIHIDYDYAIDVLLYLMDDESAKYHAIRKKKLSPEQQEKLSKILEDVENKNKGTPSSVKTGLLKMAVMLYSQQEYPEIHQGLSMIDQTASIFLGTKPAPKEISAFMVCKKGLLVLLEAPGFKTTERLSVMVDKEWLIVSGGGFTTAGYKPLNVKVEIPPEHLYDQDGV